MSSNIRLTGTPIANFPERMEGMPIILEKNNILNFYCNITCIFFPDSK